MSRRYTSLLLRIILISVLVILIAACDKKEKDSSSSTTPTVTAIKLYLEAPQIEYAGIYAAISQGYFANEQLEVELIYAIDGGSSSTNEAALEGVTSGLPIFMDSNAESVLAYRQQGEDLVAVLALYQRDSRSIISNTNRGVTVPADLVGKRLLVLPGDELMTREFLLVAGVDPEDVTFVSLTPDQGLDALITAVMGGQFDGFVNSIEVAVQLAAVGFPSTRLSFVDYGIQSYPNLLVTSNQLIEENPKVVQRFVNAVVRGLKYSLERPEAVATWFVSHYGNQLPVVQLRTQTDAIRAIIPLMQTTSDNPGMMTSASWNRIAKDFKQYNLLDAETDPDAAYTTKFLDAYYR